jgi:hypothetical protein
MFDYKLEHLFSYTARLAPPEIIGPVPEGIRINMYVTGGEVTGPTIRGTIRPVGGDWFTIRQDGVGILDVRATIETEDGALIYLAYTGVAELGPDGYQKFLAGDAPPSIPLRVAPRMHTAHPDYAWLNRLQCVSVGEADLARSEVSYDVYAVR